MKNELKIDDVCYKLCEQNDTLKSQFYVTKDDNDNLIEFSLDCYFDENLESSEESSVSPSLCINNIDLSAKNIKDLNGFSFKVKTAEESYEREDTFYYYEHEPFENYTLTVNSYNDTTATFSIVGTAIIDGYSDPYKTKQIEAHCTLPVKIHIQKQELLRFNSKGINGKKIFASNYEFVFYKDMLVLLKGKDRIREIYYSNIKKIILEGSKATIICNNENVTIKNVANDVYNKIKNIINK